MTVQNIQIIIRNTREAVEKELGPIIGLTGTMNVLPYQTYIELIRGILFNAPKEFNLNNKEQLF